MGRRAGFIRLMGCNLACSWCFAPDTPVLMADWTWKPISDIQVGDLVWSFRNRRYEIARVERTVTRTAAERVSVRFGDREVVCTPDHVFATPHQIDGRLRSRADELEGRHVRVSKMDGWSPDEMVRNEEWWTGWLQGLILGDGHVGQSEVNPYPKVWLRVCDRELAQEYSREVNSRGAKTTVREAKRRTATGRIVYSVVHTLARAPEVIGLPDTPDGIAGFLAGFFDAEGTMGDAQISMSQVDHKTLDRVSGMCLSLGIPNTLAYGDDGKAGSVTVNGLANVDRFLRITRPILDRKSKTHRRVDRMLGAVKVDQVKEVENGPVVNLTTSTGFFFANGALVEQCDTPYTWDASRFDLRAEGKRMTVSQILKKVSAGRPELAVITGGEPLLHQGQDGWVPLLSGLVEHGMKIEVETNGTVAPLQATENRVARFNVSPKLSHSGDAEDKRLNYDILRKLVITGCAVFKFVARDGIDLEQVDKIVQRAQIPNEMVWIMPLGTDAASITQGIEVLAPLVVQRCWNLTTRLHVLAYGDKRGV